MDKVKYETAKELELKLEVLKKMDNNKTQFYHNSGWGITGFPGFIQEKFDDKIRNMIKNEISLLEEEFNSL